MSGLKDFSEEELQIELDRRLSALKKKSEVEKRVQREAEIKELEKNGREIIAKQRVFEFTVPARILIAAKNEKEARAAIKAGEVLEYHDEICFGGMGYAFGASFAKTPYIRDVTDEKETTECSFEIQFPYDIKNVYDKGWLRGYPHKLKEFRKEIQKSKEFLKKK